MKKIQYLLTAVCVASLVSGCGQKEENAPTSGGAPAAAKKLKLAFVSNNAANFWSFARAGCNAAATELGDVDVDFRITQDGSSATQRQILDDLCAKGTDGIAVSVNDPDNQTDFLNKVAGETLLVCCDSDAANSKRVAYIGTDNEAAGEQAGALIKEALPSGGKIMLFVGHSDSQNAVERSGGIKKALEAPIGFRGVYVCVCVLSSVLTQPSGTSSSSSTGVAYIPNPLVVFMSMEFSGTITDVQALPRRLRR